MALTIWVVREAVELHWREWGADSVVYEARSGQVVLFDPLSAAVMAYVEERPASVTEIAAELSGDVEDIGAEEFSKTIEKILQNFSKLGWLAVSTVS